MTKRTKKVTPTLPPVIGGKPSMMGVPLIGPGWYGMVPALYTEKRTLLVFVPPEVFASLSSHDGEIRVTTQGIDSAMVAKLYAKV